MKKKLFYILIGVFLIIGVTGCSVFPVGNNSEKQGNVIFSVNVSNKECVTKRLTLYDDNQYELFTAYKACKPGQMCTMELVYTKSVKGTYDYDIFKILNECTNTIDKAYSIDSLPVYEIYLGEKYIEKYNTISFTIEDGQTNRYLDELLDKLNIDLSECAEPDYIN